jgi:hypothetical protein
LVGRPDNQLYYFSFVYGRKCLRLVYEAYLDDNGRANPSLMVVYYGLFGEELKIAGHAYRQHESDKTKLVPWASWESGALHHVLDRNYVDVFYLHERDVGPITHLKVRGTTICKLPISHRFYLGGSFLT